MNKCIVNINGKEVEGIAGADGCCVYWPFGEQVFFEPSQRQVLYNSLMPSTKTIDDGFMVSDEEKQ